MNFPSLIFSSVARALGFGGTAQQSGEQFSGPISQPESSPVRVTEDVALTLSAVWGAVRILVETVSSIPIYEYVLRSGKWILDESGDVYRLLQLQPNQWMTYIDFWECVVLNLVLRGNGYAYIMRNGTGQPVGLYPLAAQQVQPVVLKDGTGWYIHTMDGEQHLINEEDMLHFRIMGNGRVGMSPLQYGAMSMGIASASDSYAGTFFQRGGKPGGVLTIDRILTPPQREEIRKNFREVHEGTGSAHRLFVLEAGMKYQQVQLSPESTQMVETRKFAVKDVARFFGVPAFLLNESEGSTSWGTGLEQQMLGFYTLTVRPYTTRIAATCRRKLIPLDQQRRRKVQYDFDELLAVDLKAKAEYLVKLGSNGVMTRNEIRDKLDMSSHSDPAANELTVQSAMIPLNKMGAVAPKTSTNDQGEKE